MNYEEAKEYLRGKVRRENLLKHMLAVGKIMEGIAEETGNPTDKFLLVGLFHDLDYETASPERHGLESEPELRRLGFDDEMVEAVKAHNELTGHSSDSFLARALRAADHLSGFLVACALIKPEKSLASVDVPFVLKKMKEKRFAAGADRNRMKEVEREIPFERLVELALEKMKEISADLGL